MTIWDRLGLVSLPTLKRLLHEMETRMGEREDAAYDKLHATIETVKEGWASLKAENAHLKELLADADENTAAAVESALAEDSEVDASKVEAADAALAELNADEDPEPEPEPEPEA